MDGARAHFLSFVDVRGPEECWPWTGGKQSGNYGSYNGSPAWRRKTSAHRAAYELFIGPSKQSAAMPQGKSGVVSNGGQESDLPVILPHS